MDQVYHALTETLIPWIDDRFGRLAAWVAGAALVALPIAGVFAAALWLTRG